jgi:hypothetical protein
MKRILILFFALFLLLDLADDGSIGKAQFVAPPSSGTHSFSSCQAGSVNTNTQLGLFSANFLHIFHRFPNLPAMLARDRAVTLIHFYFRNSSGGLPL